MSYFTETFESILETKSQALADNERSIQHSRQSNEWQRRNKTTSDHVTYSPTYTNKRGQKEAEKAAQPMRTADDYRRREKLYGADAKAGDRGDKVNAKYRDFVSKHPTAQKIIRKAANHESYDPVYEDLCRMGIID